MLMPAQNLIIITATYSYLVSLQHAQHVTWKRQGALLWRYQSESTRFYLSPAGDVAEIAVTLFVLENSGLQQKAFIFKSLGERNGQAETCRCICPGIRPGDVQ